MTRPIYVINDDVNNCEKVTHQVDREVLKECSSPPLNAMEGIQLMCIKATVAAKDGTMSTLCAPEYAIPSTLHTNP